MACRAPTVRWPGFASDQKRSTNAAALPVGVPVGASVAVDVAGGGAVLVAVALPVVVAVAVATAPVSVGVGWLISMHRVHSAEVTMRFQVAESPKNKCAALWRRASRPHGAQRAPGGGGAA